MTPDRLYTSRIWRRIRVEVLARDGHRCRIAGPTCTSHATCVDHIVPILAGGAWLDPTNLRAACAQCNRARVGTTRAEAGRERVGAPPRTPPPSRQW